MNNPYAPPGLPGGPSPFAAPPNPYGASGLANQARFEGDKLVVLKNAQLPNVCMKCGARDGVAKQEKKFQWTPPWARWLFLVCNIAAFIAIAITTKRASLMVPLCQPCTARWTAARATIIVAVIALVLSIFSFGLSNDPTPGFVIFGLAFVGFIVLMFAFVRPRMLIVAKIDDTEISFKNYDRAGAEAIIRGG